MVHCALVSQEQFEFIPQERDHHPKGPRLDEERPQTEGEAEGGPRADFPPRPRADGEPQELLSQYQDSEPAGGPVVLHASVLQSDPFPSDRVTLPGQVVLH